MTITFTLPRADHPQTLLAVSQGRSRDNALNFVRLVLAVLVVVSHAFTIGDFGAEPNVRGVTLGTIAVGGFFSISGYLVTGSRESRSFVRYLWARVLRIFPGFWVCLLVVAVVFAPLGAIVYGGWSGGAAVHYVGGDFLLYMRQFNVGGTLHGAPYADAWNGSLWTLWLEFICYLLLGALFFVPVVRRRRWPLAVVFVLGTVATLLHNANHLPHSYNYISPLFIVLPYFLAGAAIKALEPYVRLHWAGAVASLAVIAALSQTGYLMPLAPLPLTYLTLYIGFVAPPWIRRINARNDISYGMYIYAFPVGQALILVHALRSAGVVVNILLTVALTVPIAAASWYLVEKRALGFKSWSPSNLLPRR